MKILTTLLQTDTVTVKLRINPRRDPTDRGYKSSLNKWTPPGGETVLIYDPIISVIFKGRSDNSNNSCMIPVNMLYQFINGLETVHTKLSTKGLYTKSKDGMFLDANVATKCAVKLSVYRDSLVLIPTIVYHRYRQDVPYVGIRFIQNGTVLFDIDHKEISEIVTTLSHMDMNTYSAVMTLTDKICEMEEKIDSVVAMQSQILSILQSQYRPDNMPRKDNMVWSNL